MNISRIVNKNQIWNARLLAASTNIQNHNVFIRNNHRQKSDGNRGSYEDSRWRFLIGIGIGSAAFYYSLDDENRAHMKEARKVSLKKTSPDEFVDGLPLYGYEEVAKHTTVETGIWVTYKHGVYDITKFIATHPGGKQILEAAGAPVDPFWDLYQQHNRPEVVEMLEAFRIGNYKDVREGDSISDLWANQPLRDPRLIMRSEKPCNAETPKEILGESFITQSNLFYVRHHLPVPEIDIEKFTLSLSDGKSKTLTFTLDDIKKFPKHEVTAALMCAGNRRSHMNTHKQTKGIEWGPGAVGNAIWGGARLKDVLEAAGIKPDENLHVQFDGMDLDATGKPYGASIPLSDAMDERKDVILAYEMNHHPIPRDHGFPLRVYIPGTVGARCVKWLNKITISTEESLSHWQRNDYKGFNPSVDPTASDYARSTSIQSLPVTSAILSPSNGDVVSKKNDYVELKGYAWSGGGQKIVRIDITTDNGKTWIDGTIDQQDKMPAGRHWAWTLWSAKIPLPKNKKEVEIWVKAVDSNYNTQPENVDNIWNARGVLNNSYDKIKIKIK